MSTAFGLSDDQIDALEKSAGLNFDDERRIVLRCGDSVDVQACAGSGKTTLLVAKLSGLIKNWSFRNRGICVLSHTNVARDEIRKKFSIWPQLRVLNFQPHFVGTFQSFCQTFLAHKAVVRRYRRRPLSMRDEDFERATVKRLQKYGSYKELFFYLERHAKFAEQTPGVFASSRLNWSFKQGNLTVSPIKQNQALGPNTTSGKQWQGLKEDLSQEGLFTYSDAFALAQWLLYADPIQAELLARRFPIVLIDEMQDTNHCQNELIKTLFEGQSIVQRFGDERQAIFSAHEDGHDEEASSFPNQKRVLTINRSLRVSASISELLKGISSYGGGSALIGDSKKADRPHTIFLFSEDSIDQVLPAFAALVHSQFGDSVDPKMTKAIGRSARRKVESKTFPLVPDYWLGYSKASNDTFVHNSFEAYVLEAERIAKSGGRAVPILLTGLAKILSRSALFDVQVATLKQLDLILEAKSQTLPVSLRRSALRVIMSFGSKAPLTPLAIANIFAEDLKNIGWSNWTNSALSFIETPIANDKFGTEQVPAGGDVYSWSSSGRSVKIGLGTIHSVKGETLRAVLMLETQFHQHDLGVLLSNGFFTGTGHHKKCPKRSPQFLKTTYVALTRATDLMCMAIQKQNIDAKDMKNLEEIGWNLKTL